MSETAKGSEYSKQKRRRGYHPVKAIDPHDGGKWDVLLSDNLMDWTAMEGMGKAKELAYTVRWTLLNPRALFRGVREIEREIDDDDWLCYVGTPDTAYNYRTGQQVPAWANQVILACVTDERVLYGWWWSACDPEKPHLPIDHKNRFGEQVF